MLHFFIMGNGTGRIKIRNLFWMVTYLFIISIGYLIENSNFSEKMYLGN